MTRLGWAVVVLAACHSPPGVPDIGGDGPCGGDVFFTGELVDWDSTETQFCGIFNAAMQVHGDASRIAHTSPNGRFQLCLAPAATTQIDITPPTMMSECTNPQSTYSVPAILIASKTVIQASALISARSFTVARAPSAGYDSTKAQVFVHVDGTPRAVSITAAHDAPQAFSGAGWAAGDTGANVYFPNVDPAAGTTTVSVAGGAIGIGDVPIAAGTLTELTVVAN